MRTINVGVVLVAILISQLAFGFPARFALAPDNSREVLLSFLQSAKRSLAINIYQFDDSGIAEAIINRIQANVTVRLLIEGDPVGGVSSNGKNVLKQIHTAMKKSSNSKNRIFIMTKKAGTRRFTYNHAKYIVADGATTFISSENFGSGGEPVPGNVGNRGWMTTLNDVSLAKEMLQLFSADAAPAAQDLIAIGPDDSLPLDEEKQAVKAHVARSATAIPAAVGNVESATLITSPNSLNGIVKVIRSATHTLDVEQMSFPSIWKVDEKTIQNPLVTEIIRAAQRGVTVRVLLNDENAFGGASFPNPKPRPNMITARLLENLARCYQLPLAGKIVDTNRAGIKYIHNKGILADGERSLVSSINGTRNSVENNREVAVLLESRDATQYYEQAFAFDWSSSAQLEIDPTSEPCPPLPGKQASFGQMAPTNHESLSPSTWMPAL